MTEETPQETQSLEQNNKDLLEHLQRLQAEFDNYRKRIERDQQEHKAQATEKTLKELLPIIDSFNLSLQHAKDAEGQVKGDDLLLGVIMINEQLQQFLEHQGLSPIPTDGQRFDPHLHEALTMVPGEQRGTVLQTYQRGYMRNGKVFRAAKVSVAK